MMRRHAALLPLSCRAPLQSCRRLDAAILPEPPDAYAADAAPVYYAALMIFLFISPCRADICQAIMQSRHSARTLDAFHFRRHGHCCYAPALRFVS